MIGRNTQKGFNLIRRLQSGLGFEEEDDDLQHNNDKVLLEASNFWIEVSFTKERREG